MDEDLYAVLGLAPGASHEQVERAFRFSLELYADDTLATYSLFEPGEAQVQRARVRQAHATLSEPARRREYDEAHGFPPPDTPVAVPAAPAAVPALTGEVTGSALRKVREARGVSLQHIASVTKIGVRFLGYIEEDRFAFLPPTVYLRGFLQEYARLLGLEPRQTAEAYMSRLPVKP